MTTPKKTWKKPELRSEEVQETLARGACSFKPPGTSGRTSEPSVSPALAEAQGPSRAAAARCGKPMGSPASTAAVKARSFRKPPSWLPPTEARMK